MNWRTFLMNSHNSDNSRLANVSQIRKTRGFEKPGGWKSEKKNPGTATVELHEKVFFSFSYALLNGFHIFSLNAREKKREISQADVSVILRSAWARSQSRPDKTRRRSARSRRAEPSGWEFTTGWMSV